MAIKCPCCGAPYAKEIPIWIQIVTCEYCRGPIELSQNLNKISSTNNLSSFSIEAFQIFLAQKKHIHTFDPVSGLLQIGKEIVQVNKDGLVEGQPITKKMVEKWIHELLTLNNK